jgi:cytochrome c-type biogenesis protein CcmE
MNKKQRFVLGISIIIVLLGYLALTSGVTSNQYEVSEAVAAKQKLGDRIIIINGSMVIDTEQPWDPLNRTFVFKLTDGIKTIDVIYRGEKPNIPDSYESIQAVVTGKFDGDVFRAYKMLTKCPSKYEGSDNIVKQASSSSG